MTSFRCLGLLLFILTLLGIGSCGAKLDSGAEADTSLGPTTMTRCAILSSEFIDFDNLAVLLSSYAANNDLKFLNDRPSGRYGTYLQIDDPYVVIDHNFFPMREPPEHMLITFRSTSDDSGKTVEDSFYSFLEGIGSLGSCEGFQAGITPGWRLTE